MVRINPLLVLFLCSILKKNLPKSVVHCYPCGQPGQGIDSLLEILYHARIRRSPVRANRVGAQVGELEGYVGGAYTTARIIMMGLVIEGKYE